MPELAIGVATWNLDKALKDPEWMPKSWFNYRDYVIALDGTSGVLNAYQQLYEARDEPLLGFIHDDCRIDEDNWPMMVEMEFHDPTIGVVGFGGARNHGDSDIYKTPYRLQQLARSDYYSNVDDAETHGTRFTGSMDVAVLDGFALIVRRELLDKMGGWEPDKWPCHHCYDYRACAEAHRYGYRVRLVGVRCHHYGGRTATTAEYQEWCKTTKWGSDAEMHRIGHRMFYDEYRDVLPWRC